MKINEIKFVSGGKKYMLNNYYDDWQFYIVEVDGKLYLGLEEDPTLNFVCEAENINSGGKIYTAKKYIEEDPNRGISAHINWITEKWDKANEAEEKWYSQDDEEDYGKFSNTVIKKDEEVNIIKFNYNNYIVEVEISEKGHDQFLDFFITKERSCIKEFMIGFGVDDLLEDGETIEDYCIEYLEDEIEFYIDSYEELLDEIDG